MPKRPARLATTFSSKKFSIGTVIPSLRMTIGGVKIVGAMSFSQSRNETVIWRQQIVVLLCGVNVVWHNQSTINIDVISLLLLEPNFQQSSFTSFIVQHVKSEVLRRDAGEHDLIFLSSSKHGDES